MDFLEAKQEIATAVDRLMEAMAAKDRGDILTHDEIKAVTGLSPYEGSWESIMRKFRLRTRAERGIELWAVNTIGFEYLTKNRQLEFVPAKRMKKASRQFRFARRAVNAIPAFQLTPRQRAMQVAQDELLSETERLIRERRANQAALLRKTEVLPCPERKAFREAMAAQQQSA